MKRGFTLLELLIGIGMFIFLLVALQSFLGAIFSSSFRSVAMKRLADSTRTSLEIMGREMRLAQNPGASGVCGLPGNTSFVISNAGKTIKFQDFSKRCVIYDYDNANAVLRKSVDNGASYNEFLGGTNAPVNVGSVVFTKDSQSAQARILITMSVNTKDPTGANQILSIDLQTTVSQREI